MPKFQKASAYGAMIERPGDIFSRDADQAAQQSLDAEAEAKGLAAEIDQLILKAHSGDQASRVKIAELRARIADLHETADIARRAEAQLRGLASAEAEKEIAQRDRHLRRKFTKLASERTDAAKRYSRAARDLLKAAKELRESSDRLRLGWNSSWPFAADGAIYRDTIEAWLSHEIAAAHRETNTPWPALKWSQRDWPGLARSISNANGWIKRALLDEEVIPFSEDEPEPIETPEPTEHSSATPNERDAPEWDGYVLTHFPSEAPTAPIAEGTDFDPHRS